MFVDDYKRAYVPGTKTTCFYTKGMYDDMVRKRLNRSDPPLLLKDPFMVEPYSFVMEPHVFMFDVLNRKLQQYIEADLQNYNAKEFDFILNRKRFEVYKETFAVLTLGELEAGFVVSLMPLILSIFAFAIEWLPALKNLIVFRHIFKTYFKVEELELSENSARVKIKFFRWQEEKIRQRKQVEEWKNEADF